MPLSPLKAMGAEVLVGIDLNAAEKYDEPDSVIDIILNAIDIAINTTTRQQLEAADVLISMDLTRYSRTDSSDLRELVAEGYHATVLQLRHLEKVLDSRQPSSWKVLEKKFREWRESID